MRIGSLCSGAGMLDCGIAQVLPVEHAWFAEIDPAASNVLAAHWPNVPNLGDITAINWAAVEPVDILAAGFPCQDVSCAGLRAGLAPGTRTGLWANVAAAIGVLQPSIVVLENVRGLLSARAASDMEPCPWCLGDQPDQPALRALGAVLGDLADLGYDATWHCLPAAAVGAAHLRWRVFILATPANAESLGHWNVGPESVGGLASTPVADGSGLGGLSLLPTPAARDWKSGGSGHGSRRGGHNLRTEVALFPTPRATDGTKGGPNQRGSSGDLMLPSAVMLLPTPTAKCSEDSQTHRSGVRSHELLLTGVALAHARDELLLPTPTAVHQARNATANRTEVKPDTNHNGWTLSDVAHAERWGDYGSAIRRWEQVTGRAAPDPTEPGSKGQPRLSPRFVEWLMGWPDGWVTSHLARNDALRVCGNGVVPQQAAYALRELLAMHREAAA